jgi:hypothetical protein
MNMWNLIYTSDLRVVYFMLDAIGAEIGTSNILEQFSGDAAGYAQAKARIQELGLVIDDNSLVSQPDGSATVTPATIIESNRAIECTRELAMAISDQNILDQLNTNPDTLSQATMRMQEIGITDADRSLLSRIMSSTISQLGLDDSGYAQIARIQELILPLMIKVFIAQWTIVR